MAIHAHGVALVVDVALGGWLGIMAFFSFVGAPRAFAVVEDDAGTYVNDVFPRYYRIGVALGTVAFVAELFGGLVGGFDAATHIVLASTAVATLVAAYSVGVLVPLMDDAGDTAFERYHRRTVVLNGLAMLAVAAALVGRHLPG